MIIRYFNIISDNSHWQHKFIAKLDLDDGFLKSCIFHTKEKTLYNTHIMPIKFYFDWLKKWKSNIDSDVLRIKYESFIDNQEVLFVKF